MDIPGTGFPDTDYPFSDCAGHECAGFTNGRICRAIYWTARRTLVLLRPGQASAKFVLSDDFVTLFVEIIEVSLGRKLFTPFFI